MLGKKAKPAAKNARKSERRKPGDRRYISQHAKTQSGGSRSGERRMDGRREK